ncbi:MAG: hypothetical protein ACR2ID_12115 [Chthoniobacterales bacterium]
MGGLFISSLPLILVLVIVILLDYGHEQARRPGYLPIGPAL